MLQAPHVVFTRDFQRDYDRLVPCNQKLVDKKIKQLIDNPAHPSLQAHRLRQVKTANIWCLYVSINKRLLYQFADEKIIIWAVGEHSIVDRVHLRRFSHY